MHNSIETWDNLCTGLGPPVIDGTLPACSRVSASRMRLGSAIQVPPTTNLESSTKYCLYMGSIGLPCRWLYL